MLISEQIFLIFVPKCVKPINNTVNAVTCWSSLSGCNWSREKGSPLLTHPCGTASWNQKVEIIGGLSWSIGWVGYVNIITYIDVLSPCLLPTPAQSMYLVMNWSTLKLSRGHVVISYCSPAGDQATLQSLKWGITDNCGTTALLSQSFSIDGSLLISSPIACRVQ